MIQGKKKKKNKNIHVHKLIRSIPTTGKLSLLLSLLLRPRQQSQIKLGFRSLCVKLHSRPCKALQHHCLVYKTFKPRILRQVSADVCFQDSIWLHRYFKQWALKTSSFKNYLWDAYLYVTASLYLSVIT